MEGRCQVCIGKQGAKLIADNIHRKGLDWLSICRGNNYRIYENIIAVCFGMLNILLIFCHFMIKGQWNFLNAIFLGRAVSATDKIFIELLSCFRLRQKGSQMEIVPDHFCHFVLFLLFIHQHAHRLQPQQLKCQDIIQLFGCSAVLWRLEKKKCHSLSLQSLTRSSI